MGRLRPLTPVAAPWVVVYRVCLCVFVRVNVYICLLWVGVTDGWTDGGERGARENHESVECDQSVLLKGGVYRREGRQGRAGQ